MIKGFITAVMAVGALATTGFAAISGPFTTSTPISATLTDWTNSLDFAKFNSALGTLNSVTLKLNGGLTTTITVTNAALSSSSGTAKTEVTFTVQDGGSNLVGAVPDLITGAYAYALGAGGSATSGPIIKTGSDTEVYTSPTILAEFNGPGTITLSAGTFTQTLLANTGGNTNASQVTDASLTGTVTYDYTPIPEPTMGLLGLVGLLACRRGRRA